MRVIHYERVSTDDQADKGISISDQDYRLSEHSKKHNHQVVKKCVDEGRSASIKDSDIKVSYSDGKIRAIIDISKRPEMKWILDNISTDLYDGVKMTKWDRFSRSGVFSKLSGILFDNHKKKLMAINDVDNILLKNITGELSEEEIRKTTERVRNVREFRFSQGIMVGRSPYGYKPIKKQKRVIGFDKHPKQSKVVEEVFKMTNQGHGYKEICDKFNLSPQSYYNMIKNKVYIGIIEFEGKERKGVHPPIISEELFNKVNQLR